MDLLDNGMKLPMNGLLGDSDGFVDTDSDQGIPVRKQSP